MKRNTSHILAGSMTAVLATALLLSGCSGEEKKAAAPAAAAGAMPPPPEVDVITVKTGAATLTHDLPGRLQAYRTAQVRARVEGVVEKRLFEEGSDVKAGQPLYQIYVGNYRGNYEAAKTDLSLAKQNLERAKQLLEAKVVSQQEYDQTEARFKQAEAAYSKAREDWDNTRVPAPISGRIGRSMVTEGALVGRGEATLLATIEQTDKLYVNFTQTESDIMRMQKAVKTGALKPSESTSIELVLEDGTLYPLPGKLLFTDMAADPSTGSVTMRAEIPNPNHELLPGMFVTVRLPQALDEHAMSIPQRAVQMSAQGQFVMVVDAEGKANPRPVKLGSMAGPDFIIEGGLQNGEQVIVNGLQKARPGTVVKPVPLEAVPGATSAPAEKK
ncbi:MAG TPA: efflux RND transporter periplasmic adaptor subunit [Sideroxyarcus sp.]|nr:efflux RND transporter periplasmic adaptor subunit [Sideroxyarcus sp.]